MHLHLVVVFLFAVLPAQSIEVSVPRSSIQQPSDEPVTQAVVGEVVEVLDNSIFHVYEAKHSVYWFGSDGQGVYRYDGNQLVQFTEAHGLSSDRVRSIQQDRAGNIFVSSEGGVSRFDGRMFRELKPLDSDDSEWKLDQDDLWFPGGQDSGVVYRWDGTSLHQLAFPETQAGESHIAEFPRSKFSNANYSPYDVYTIYKDSKGNLWFGTAVLGACRYDGTTFVWIGHGENSSFGVRSIVEDQEGKFFLSNTLSRFVEISPDANQSDTARYQKEIGIATDTDPYSVFMSTVRDADGDLWMATLSNGVFQYDGNNWTHFPVTHDDEPIWVYSIYLDRKGGLWLGTHEYGVYKFNGSMFEKFNF